MRVLHKVKSINTRAVLDQCSNVNLCTERLLKQLNTDGPRKPFTVNTVTGTKTALKSVATQLMITAIDDSTTINVQDVRSVPQLPVNFSSMADSKNMNEFSHLKDIMLPNIENEHVDILIGSGCTQAFIVEDQAVGAPGEPYAAKYPLGWTIIGPSKRTMNEPAIVNLQSEVTNEKLSEQIQKLWNHDCIDASSSKRAMSLEDKTAVKIAESSIRKVEGRYQVRIPFKTSPRLIPNNRSVAEKRLRYLKNKLIRKPHLQESYIKTMSGYLRNGYIRPEPKRPHLYGAGHCQFSAWDTHQIQRRAHCHPRRHRDDVPANASISGRS